MTKFAAGQVSGEVSFCVDLFVLLLRRRARFLVESMVRGLVTHRPRSRRGTRPPSGRLVVAMVDRELRFSGHAQEDDVDAWRRLEDLCLEARHAAL